MVFQGSEALGQAVGSAQSLQYCKALKAIGEVLVRHDKGGANPILWK